jgi:sulfatase modifying factor 1
MRIHALSLWLPLWSALLWLTPPASAVTIDWVAVGNPGNACETQPIGFGQEGCFGAVGSAYRISKYEITNAQYAEFLNAVAGASDPLELYSTNMDPSAGSNGGITQSGSTYTAVSGRENMPVNHVSLYDALRFANWLNNGQASGDTETGAYALLGGAPEPSNGATVTRNAGAAIVLPSEDEWYKAAYYDAVSTSYYDYPASSNTQTTCATPGATANTANCNNAVGDLTGAGGYTGSASPYGTFDQGGNVGEWTETVIGSSSRVWRGGSFNGIATNLAASDRHAALTTTESSSLGFRVAIIPEPQTGLLLMTGMLALAGWRRRSRRAPPAWRG